MLACLTKALASVADRPFSVGQPLNGHFRFGTLAEELFARAKNVHLVVTSQLPLKARGERIFPIGPLDVPQNNLPTAEALKCGSVKLFVDKALAVDAHFVLRDEDMPAVIDLCRELNGLPLAIELVAALVPTLGVQQLVQSLSDTRML